MSEFSKHIERVQKSFPQAEADVLFKNICTQDYLGPDTKYAAVVELLRRVENGTLPMTVDELSEMRYDGVSGKLVKLPAPPKVDVPAEVLEPEAT